MYSARAIDRLFSLAILAVSVDWTNGQDLLEDPRAYIVKKVTERSIFNRYFPSTAKPLCRQKEGAAGKLSALNNERENLELVDLQEEVLGKEAPVDITNANELGDSFRKCFKALLDSLCDKDSGSENLVPTDGKQFDPAKFKQRIQSIPNANPVRQTEIEKECKKGPTLAENPAAVIVYRMLKPEIQEQFFAKATVAHCMGLVTGNSGPKKDISVFQLILSQSSVSLVDIEKAILGENAPKDINNANEASGNDRYRRCFKAILNNVCDNPALEGISGKHAFNLAVFNARLHALGGAKGASASRRDSVADSPRSGTDALTSGGSGNGNAPQTTSQSGKVSEARLAAVQSACFPK